MAAPRKGRRRALGRGLDALIPGDATSGLGYRELPIGQIDPSPHQPRHHFDHRSLEELAASIARYGILQPLVVVPSGAGRFRLVAGERRLRAARLAGLERVPAIVREVDDQESLVLALTENVQRADLNPIEEARALLQMMDVLELSQDAVAERLGKSRAWVANKVRLLNLPEPLQEELAAGNLSEGHARALLGLEDPDEMLAAAEEVIAGGFTVRDTEALVRERKRARRERTSEELDPDWAALERTLEVALGTPVEIRRRRRGGVLVIRYYDDEQLDRLLHRLVPAESFT